MTFLNERSLQIRQSLVFNVLQLTDQPVRTFWRVIGSFFAIEILLIVAHVIVRTALQSVVAGTSDGSIGGFDLADEATLAVWFSSFQLLLLALISVALSWVDRPDHSPSGRAALWKFSAIVFFVMAIDETAGLHEIFGKTMAVFFAGAPLTARHWGMLPYAIGVTVMMMSISVRLIGRPFLLAGVVGSWLLWVVGQGADQLSPFSPDTNIMLEEGLEMAGATVVLIALGRLLMILSHARAPTAYTN